MNKQLKLLAMASLCSALFPSAVLADEFSQPAAAPIEEVKAKTCVEAKRDAEFIREMKRTDGDTNPALDDVPECVGERADA